MTDATSNTCAAGRTVLFVIEYLLGPSTLSAQCMRLALLGLLLACLETRRARCMFDAAVAAANLTCVNGAEVKNVGNVRLVNTSIRGDVNCSMPPGQLLDPGSSFNCTVCLS